MNIPISILNRLHTQHLSLPAIIKGLGNDWLEYNIIPGKWSIRDNIAHLVRYQPILIDRINTFCWQARSRFQILPGRWDVFSPVLFN